MIKRRGLDRGLNSLLSDSAKSVINGEELKSTLDHTPQQGEVIQDLSVDLLQRGQYQPRRDFNEESLQELAASIKTQGLIQPIIVRKIPGNHYEIIAGERRWRATQLAGLQTIPAIVRNLDDQPAMAIALIENIQRRDLNPIEEAMALQRLSEEFGLTHEQVSESVGKSRVTVTNLLRLLKLPAEVKTLLQENKIQMGHARALLSLDNAHQLTAARMIVAKSLSVREAENVVRKLLTGKKAELSAQATDPNVEQLQNKLSETLAAEVIIHASAKGKGKLEIRFNSLDELDGILAHIS
jgi:ParB family chromosome partitioning protein